ncbi:DUF1845 domain-containing protein [Roseateles flavus]|uniref:DUF1845 domain-containing protein n=1 Tax=Roseateles flavus TaxID=3149041 RepID=A0ABV0GKM1_9BURK
MANNLTSAQIVKTDEGAVNARILARESKVDFRRVEAASIKVVTRLTSAEGKRLFVRFFSTLQLNAHFISVLARTRLESSDVGKVEESIRARIDAAADALNKAIDGAEALFQAHGITSAATYDTLPLEIEVGIISSTGRRYLELLSKFDQVMPLLQTLEIHEVISTQALDLQRATLKRQVRDVANSARSLATGLRRRMQALAAGSGERASNGEAVVATRLARDDHAGAAVEEDGEALERAGLAGAQSEGLSDEATDPGLIAPSDVATSEQSVGSLLADEAGM